MPFWAIGASLDRFLTETRQNPTLILAVVAPSHLYEDFAEDLEKNDMHKGPRAQERSASQALPYAKAVCVEDIRPIQVRTCNHTGGLCCIKVQARQTCRHVDRDINAYMAVCMYKSVH